MISQKLPTKNAPGNCTNKKTPGVGTVLDNLPIQVTMGKRPEVGALGKDMAPDGGPILTDTIQASFKFTGKDQRVQFRVSLKKEKKNLERMDFQSQKQH